VSVTDRWVGPCEQILNVPIACWYMSTVSLVAYREWRVALPPLLQWLPRGEKLCMDPWIDQPSCCGLGQESFFSGAVALFITVDDFLKDCYTWITWDTYGRGSYVNRAWKACGMLVGFFPVGCTLIQIIVTLRYEYRLFVTIITQ
jgi:hypothetical protein